MQFYCLNLRPITYFICLLKNKSRCVYIFEFHSIFCLYMFWTVLITFWFVILLVSICIIYEYDILLGPLTGHWWCYFFFSEWIYDYVQICTLGCTKNKIFSAIFIMNVIIFGGTSKSRWKKHEKLMENYIIFRYTLTPT